MREVIASHGNRVNDLLDKDGWTLLCAAAKHGRHEFLLELISDFDADVFSLTPDLCTPLHFANCYETAGILIHHGGDAIVEKMNNQGMTPLMRQCAELCVGPVRRLLEHPKVKQETNVRFFSLHSRGIRILSGREEEKVAMTMRRKRRRKMTMDACLRKMMKVTTIVYRENKKQDENT